MTYKTIGEAQNVLVDHDDLYDKTDEIVSAVTRSNWGYLEDIQIGPVETVVLYNDYYDSYQVKFPSKYYTMEQEDINKDIKIREELERKKKEKEIAEFEAANKKRKYEAEYQKYLELKEKFENKTLT